MIKEFRERVRKIVDENTEPTNSSSFLEDNVNYAAKFEVSALYCDELEKRLSVLELQNAKMEKTTKEAISEAIRVNGLKFHKINERNLATIDALMAEQKTAAATRLQLENERDELSAKLRRKMCKNEDVFRQEIQREKEILKLKEKQIRTKWESKRIAEIKQQTIQGLEPEIERIIANHKNEKKIWDAKNIEQAEIFNAEIAKLRTDFATQISAAVDTERGMFVERERKSFDRFAAQLEAERIANREELDRLKELHSTQLAAAVMAENEQWKLRLDLRGAEERQKLENETEQIRSEISAEKDAEIETIIGRFSRENLALIEASRRRFGEEMCLVQEELQGLKVDNESNQKLISLLETEKSELQKEKDQEEKKNTKIRQNTEIRYQEILRDERTRQAEQVAALQEANNTLTNSIAEVKKEMEQIAAQEKQAAEIMEENVKRMIENKNLTITQMEERLKFVEAKNCELIRVLKNKHM